MVPALNELPDGAATLQVTVLSVTLAPATVAENWTVVPIVAVVVPGVTVTVDTDSGPKVAVTVVAAFIVTLHVVVLVVVQPVHAENLLLPVVAGAVSVTAAPEL
jgi:hypothetical protein